MRSTSSLGELEEHDFAGGVANHHAGHPRTLDIEFDLKTDDGSDEEGNDENKRDGVESQLIHLGDILLVEHTHAVGHRKGSPNDLHVSAQFYKSSFQLNHCLILVLYLQGVA